LLVRLLKIIKLILSYNLTFKRGEGTMKTKNLIIGLVCIFVLVLVFSLSTKSQKPAEQGQVYDKGHAIGQGTCPEFMSPDTIAFIDNHGFLTIVDLEGKSPKKIGKIHALGFRYTGDEFIYWDYQKGDDGSTIYAINTIDRTGKESRVDNVRKTLGGDTKNISAPVVLPDGTVGYWIEQYGGQYFTILHKGNSPNPLKQWIGDIKPSGNTASGEVWVRRVDGSDSFRVSPKGGERDNYSFPRLFFDGTQQCGQKLLVVKNGLYILEFDDSLRTLKSLQPLGNPGGVIGENMTIDSVTYRIVLGGIVSLSATWSSNCKWVVCSFELWGTKYNEDDGNPIGSDIKVISSDGSVNIRIETPDIMESNPRISSDGTVVCQTDEGKIIVYRKIK
jgi:hypothetical protein